jgi:hypothetical protein
VTGWSSLCSGWTRFARTASGRHSPLQGAHQRRRRQDGLHNDFEMMLLSHGCSGGCAGWENASVKRGR